MLTESNAKEPNYSFDQIPCEVSGVRVLEVPSEDYSEPVLVLAALS